MSLYYKTAELFITKEVDRAKISRSAIFAQKQEKASIGLVSALVYGAGKWSEVLSLVIQRAGLLDLERKLTPELSILLVHDLLLSKRGISAPKTHVLRAAVERHKARLQAEFTKERVRRKFSTVAEFGQSLGGISVEEGQVRRPRWVRVNTVKSSWEHLRDTLLKGYTQKSLLTEVSQAGPQEKVYHIDEHVPNLFAVPQGTDLTSTAAYKNGEIILQDKASCFPAYLLNPQAVQGDVVDGCSAPGNKTTHLAALLAEHNGDSTDRRIHAVEKDKKRAVTLKTMVARAISNNLVQIHAGLDFLTIDPRSDPWQTVEALLLDPSCSGSGIPSREDSIDFVLPPSRLNKPELATRNGPTRKREPISNNSRPEVEVPEDAENEVMSDDDSKTLQTRLASLSGFQTKIVLHAMSFPRARVITYSTCSFHAEENEEVALRVLSDANAKAGGWRLLRRDEQVDGMRRWPRRGDLKAAKGNKELEEACLRCVNGTEEGTQGFFVVAFVRDVKGDQTMQEFSDQEWSGLSDTE